MTFFTHFVPIIVVPEIQAARENQQLERVYCPFKLGGQSSEKIYICFPISKSVLDKFDKCKPKTKVRRTAVDPYLIRTIWL